MPPKDPRDSVVDLPLTANTPVVLSRITDELQGILFPGSAVVKLRVVFSLSLRHCSADFDNRQFIAADPAVQDFFSSSNRIERPPSISVLFQRDGESEIVGPHKKNLAAIRHPAPAVHRLITSHECIYALLVLHRIAGGNQVFRVRTENC